MPFFDNDLIHFEQAGCNPPAPQHSGGVPTEGAVIWFQTWGRGQPVVLLHGGLGHGGNFGRLIPALAGEGYQVIAIDTRGQGRSSGRAPFSYDQFARDLLAVLDFLHVQHAALVGWSDGAATALVFARQNPHRTVGVYYFGCNMDPSGTLPFVPSARIDRCLARHRADYERLSPTLIPFDELMPALGKMQAEQPNYSAQELGEVRVPVTVAQAEFDEFIKPEHARHIAACIAGARYEILPGVSHFAPLQQPALFNESVLHFLRGLEKA